MDEPWSLYLALCAGYIVLVFGLIWSYGKWGRHLGGGKWTRGKLLRGHVSFLLALILWIWLARFSRPWLPDRLMNEAADHLTLYLIFAAFGILLIWWVEQSWLSKGPKKDENVQGESIYSSTLPLPSSRVAGLFNQISGRFMLRSYLRAEEILRLAVPVQSRGGVWLALLCLLSPPVP